MSGEKTTREYWDGVYERRPRQRLPLPLRAGTRNLQRLFRRYIRRGDSVLEVGCAPGKYLAWVAARLGARVAGVEYAPRGVELCRELFSSLRLEGDIRCEDVFQTTFPDGRFDVVYSVGVIEHFEDPSPLVRKHAELVRPGGTALILIPNYGGVYGRLQRWLDPDNLAIHNLSIMKPEALRNLAPADLAPSVDAFRAGRMDFALLNLERRAPAAVARACRTGVDLLSALQPIELAAVAPIVALVLRRQSETPTADPRSVTGGSASAIRY